MMEQTVAGLVILTAGLAVSARAAVARQAEQSEREAMYYRYQNFRSYVRGGSIEPHWLADGSSFWYAEGEPENPVIWKVDPEANTKTRLSVAPDSSSAELEGPAPRRGEVPSLDGRWIATVREHNVWLRSTDDGTERQLTSDGMPDYDWSPGMQWSPNGSMLAIIKADFRQAPKVPLVDWLGPREEVDWAGFDRKPGQPIRRSELFLIDVPSGEKVRVDVAQHPDQRIHLVQWLPDGSELLFFAWRDYHPGVVLMAADARTGSTRSVLVEERPVGFRTVGPHPGETPLTLVENGKQFVWVSGRTGWRHLYLYDVAGNLVRPLTRGEFSVRRVVRVDQSAGWVYFMARGDPDRPHHRPYDTHLYRVSLRGDGLSRLTDAPGHHQIRFTPSGQFFLDTHSSSDRPPAVDLRRADGELLRTLATAHVAEELRWTPPEEFVVKAADGETDLHGLLYKPFDFDPRQKYPVILFAHVAAQRTFAGDLWPLATAQLGFIVFQVDVRDMLMPRRGGELDSLALATVGHYGVPDWVAALHALAAERPYMDLSRVGVFGRSNAGYHAIRAMLQAPEVFHVGIAVAAITDAYGHPNFYGRGSPEDNREAYEAASNLPLAGNLKGKLLLVHGTHDTAVPFSHAMKMVDALTRAGKPYDLIVLPGWGHWWPDTEAWERYRFEAYRRYFQKHLKPDAPEPRARR